MSVADPEIDQLYDPIVTVPRPPVYVPLRPESMPRPRRRRACVIAIVAILLVAYAAAVAVYLVDLLTHSFVPEGNYLPLVNGTMQMLIWAGYVYAIKDWRRANLQRCETPSLSIFASGIVLDGQFVLWKNVRSCRWNRYFPDTLVIAVNAGHSHWRHPVWIPKSQRALVKKTFLRFGKWDQPEAVDEVALQTGMSIKLSA